MALAKILLQRLRLPLVSRRKGFYISRPNASSNLPVPRHPVPYQTLIQPRNKTARDLIVQSDISDTY